MLKKGLLAALLFSTLVGCGPGNVQQQSSTSAQVALDDIAQYIETANALEGEERSRRLTTAAQSLYVYGKIDWSRNVLSSIDPRSFQDADGFIQYSLLSANLSLEAAEPFSAKHSLFNPRFESSLTSSSIETQIQAREARANLLFDIGEYSEAVTERIKLDALLANNTEARELNQDNLWQTLMEISVSDLELEAKAAQSSETSGWYTLAALSKSSQTDLSAQLNAVENWAMLWPEHPASLRLPSDLQLLKQLVENHPKKIALFLPLSGKLSNAASALRDGFMAAHYQASINATTQPVIRIYDTEQYNIIDLYERAVAEGVEVVIGPLNKDKIDELALLPELPVPTLALNYVDNESIPTASNLYQFGLRIDDEVQQIANRAWRDGYRRALVLAPTSSWGDKAIATFSKAWQAQNGEIVSTHQFNAQKDYSRLIKDALKVADSQTRARQIRQLIGKSVEFEPRRRKDIDVIILIAHPSQARQIKPTLAFHYGGDLPVYSSSHVYDGSEDSKANSDMNGIRFTSLPWYFDNTREEKKEIDKYTHQPATFDRLYAMGVDAYSLYPRLKQLEQVTKAHFYGATGSLSMSNTRQIQRTQSWAQFVRGKAVLVPTVSVVDE
ncbi:penicillin-binding protein activator [Teredinibacter sp. KSP-S5-2]|uniref:penicillin-binding protein activator n=1 Tax=Teredinibacter sp. KSP-S5-2 TaxID=3034506 RepID=UPI0029352690|nr:penicillin-binding protein activator [Teredinibacter sp. KSP-S5-2]WNO08524.1 penicillin-binding protein activator [Teredinibacter sp. KSP-S5-2]